MKHRNFAAMLANARAAIPTDQPLSANQIFKRQQLPRLPLDEVRELCEGMARTGYVERISIGRMTYYRHRETPLALSRAAAYNAGTGSTFSTLSTEVDWFLSVLYPLRQGHAVHLSLDDPRFAKIKNYRGGKKKRLVLLVPGQLIGMTDQIIVVSIIGAGSALVRPTNPGQTTADLVLAGMPAPLATALMNKIHQLFKDQ